jgi:hypothetical protein
MINVAITGLYVQIIEEGMKQRAWQEPQLEAFQEQLAHINLPPFVVMAFRAEAASTKQTLETMPLAKLHTLNTPDESRWQKIKNERLALVPKGWIYQNLALADKFISQQPKVFNAESNLIQPGICERIFRDQSDAISRGPGAYTFLVAEYRPNFTRAWQTTAYNQTMVNEALIACALERCRLAHGDYPDSLDALTPGYLQTLPQDIIGGEPLHYRLTDSGKFLLYSVGWNERDDGGQQSPNNKTTGRIDFEKGDWVWLGGIQ